MLERFEAIVDAAKKQELEIGKLELKVADLKKELEARPKELPQIKQVKIEPGKFGSKTREESKDNSWNEITHGIVGLTTKPDLKGKIMAKVNFKHPITGRATSKSAVREGLVEAIIARNEIAGILLREGFIDLETFGKYTAI